MQQKNRTIVELTVVGKDRTGIVASFTNFIFRNRGNIEAINQNVFQGLFGMHLEASFTNKVDERELNEGLRSLGKKLGMEVGIHYQETQRSLNLAVMVTKERQCIEGILKAVRNGGLKANVTLVIGSEGTLERVADANDIPFYTVNNPDQSRREKRILQLLQKYNVDLIALSRYMRVLSPSFVWRYPNKIINVHPSLLPAFPGALAYQQAYERGARIMGCTAHFVTMDLDEGPIIWQEAFKVRPGESLQSIRQRGQELEAKAIVKALQLYTEGRVEVRWGKVYFG